MEEEESGRDKSCSLQKDQECDSSREGMKEASCIKYFLVIPFSEGCTLQGGPTPTQEVKLNRNFLLCVSDHLCP